MRPKTIDEFEGWLKEQEQLLLAGDTDEAGKVVREMQSRMDHIRQLAQQAAVSKRDNQS